MERDSAVFIAPWSAILEVPLDRVAHVAQLRTYLVMSSRMKRHGQQTVAVAHGETLVGEPGTLSLSVRLRHDVALVLLTIAIEQILSLSRFLRKSTTDHSVVDFVDLSSLKHSVEPCQSLSLIHI